MLFNSLQFLLFYPVTTAIYFLVKHRNRIFILLGASLIFYMFSRPVYVLLPIGVTLISFFGAIKFTNAKGKKRKWYFVISLILIFAILGFFKYYNFANSNLGWLSTITQTNLGLPKLHIILPIGLSFYTFQAASYLIEVYLGRQKLIKKLPVLASFIIFYPTMLAGPIERPTHLIPQLLKRKDFNYQGTVEGLRLIIWGLFKKIVVANRLAILVNRVYDHPSDFSGWSLVLATFFYAFQIYYDFSAYAEIAIGVAKVMGIDLFKNFNRPYFSKSIPEFWRRWNITLSGWMRDYIYIPLGGSRVSFWHHKINLLITFLVSGIWHGANWTFIFWGILHGIYCVVDSLIDKVRENMLKKFRINRYFLIALQVSLTFILTSFAWIFFRSKNMTEAFWIIRHLSASATNLTTLSSVFGLKILLVAVLAILLVEIFQSVIDNQKPEFFFLKKNTWLRWTFYYVLIFAILFSFSLTNQQFIYFQF